MKDADLRVAVVRYIEGEVRKIKKRPHTLKYSAKIVAEYVGGYAPSVGRISSDVVNDLQAIGINCRYAKEQNPKAFIVEVSDA